MLGWYVAVYRIVCHMKTKEFREDEDLCIGMLVYFRMMMEEPPDLGELVSQP